MLTMYSTSWCGTVTDSSHSWGGGIAYEVVDIEHDDEAASS